ncbi:MAG: cation:proton antiporter [Bacteroidales bacterium]|nr:cation:proton antiporter [Bacteroidales bacterium]
MTHLLNIHITFPLEDPVMVFFVIMLIVLVAPPLFKKVRVPAIVGLILSGLLIGPYGINLLARDNSIVLLGTVGLLYIMFLAGIEINLHDFNKRRGQSFVFGAISFIIPFLAGVALSYYLFGYPLVSSILIGAIFSSHTLVTYPIVSRFGLSRLRSVNIAIGGTIFTDLLSLIILSVIANLARNQDGSNGWMIMILTVPLFGLFVLYVVPYIARWYFKRTSNRISQFIFVLASLFLSAFLAEVAMVEPVIGAFLAGLAFNRLIPHTSGLMNRLEFMGNALFIPVFLIGVGMLIDISILFNGRHALFVVFFTIAFAVLSKYIAAWITQKIYSFSGIERLMIFGLSNSRAAAALAAAIIGFNIIIGVEGQTETARLLGEEVLNATILLILVSIGISSFAVEKAARVLAMKDETANMDVLPEIKERILVPVSNPDTVESLIEFASIIKTAKSNEPLHILNVVDKEHDSLTAWNSEKLITRAKKAVSALNVNGTTMTRYDLNAVLGILHTIKEKQVSDLVIGIFGRHSYAEKLFGSINDNIIRHTNISVFLSCFVQPLNTVERILVFIPPKAEFEPGFVKWLGKIRNIASKTGQEIVFFADNRTAEHINFFLTNQQLDIKTDISDFSEWDSYSNIINKTKKNDLVVIVNARPDSISYFSYLDVMPVAMSRYLTNNNFILIYPEQYDSAQNITIRDLGGTLTGQVHKDDKVFTNMRVKFRAKSRGAK